MSLILGNSGNVKLRRGNSVTWTEMVVPDDVNPNLNRLGIENAIDNVLIGDRIRMETDDPRGLLFLDSSTWSTGQVERTAAPYVHVNAMGGCRLFREITDAINNDRSSEIRLREFTGAPIEVRFTIRDTIYNTLASVEGFKFNSDRAAIDTTELGDRFRQMYEAGLLSGSGTLDCLFQHSFSTCANGDPVPPKELPLVMMQLIQRVDVGSSFDAALHVTDKDLGGGISVFYQVSAVITRSGVDVRAADITKVAIDFVTTGEYRLLVGDPQGFLLKEDDFYIEKERGLGFLLKEETD